MKATMTLILVALAVVGCSSTSSQTPVESALDHVESEQEAEASDGVEMSDDDVLRMADGSAAHEELHASFAEVDASGDAADEELAASVDDERGDGSSEADSEVVEAIAEDESLRLGSAVRELGGFGDRDVVTLARFRRGARNVIIAWPVVTSSGSIAGSSVYGLCIEEQSDGSFESCGERWRVNEVTSSAAALAGALGGSDYEVVRGQSSSSLDELGSRLTANGNAFVAAATEGDGNAMVRAAQDFMEMLPVEDVAFDNTLAQLLVTAARTQRSFHHLKTETGDLLASISFKLQGDWHEVTTMQLTAQQIDGTSSEWRIVDFW